MAMTVTIGEDRATPLRNLLSLSGGSTVKQSIDSRSHCWLPREANGKSEKGSFSRSGLCQRRDWQTTEPCVCPPCKCYYAFPVPYSRVGEFMIRAWFDWSLWNPCVNVGSLLILRSNIHLTSYQADHGLCFVCWIRWKYPGESYDGRQEDGWGTEGAQWESTHFRAHRWVQNHYHSPPCEITVTASNSEPAREQGLSMLIAARKILTLGL